MASIIAKPARPCQLNLWDLLDSAGQQRRTWRVSCLRLQQSTQRINECGLEAVLIGNAAAALERPKDVAVLDILERTLDEKA